MNIIFSGWPASGGSTLAMITASITGYKYIYAGGLLKFLAEKMYGPNNQMKFETINGVEWDSIWESYISKKLHHAEGFLVEGKTAGFMIDGQNIFKVMVVADAETRANRALIDTREQNAVEVIKQRDVEVRQRWIDNLGIDVYNLDAISRIFDMSIDVSEMTVMEEIEIMIDGMRRSMKFEGIDFSELVMLGSELNEIFLKSGKLGIRQKLESQGLIFSSQQILADWQELVPDLVEQLSDPLKQMVTQY